MKKTTDNANATAVKKVIVAVIIVISAIVLLGVILLLPTLRANRALDNAVEYLGTENSVTQVLVTDLNSTSEQVGEDAKETLVTDSDAVSALISALHAVAKKLEADTVAASSLGAWGIRLRMYSDNDSPCELILTENSVIIADGERMYSYTLEDEESLETYSRLYENISSMLK